MPAAKASSKRTYIVGTAMKTDASAIRSHVAGASNAANRIDAPAHKAPNSATMSPWV